MTTAASDLFSSDPPDASCLVVFVAAEVDAVAVGVASAAEAGQVAGFAADDKSAAESEVSAPFRSVAESLPAACSAEAGSAAPGDLPAVVRQDDHSAVAVGLDDSVAAYSLPDGCSVVRPDDHRA